MNETPERICEALEWLYGGEWRMWSAPHGTRLIFKGTTGDAVEFVDGVVYFQHANDDDGFGVIITDRLNHALAVTAPWEWKDLRGTSVRQAKGERFMACVGRPDSGDGPFCLSVHAKDIRLSETGFDDIEQAQTAARAAYLCWMRGRFAMKGMSNE